ncbi:carnitine O-acetyltransferase-like isoform X2 [Watersipora subatra]
MPALQRASKGRMFSIQADLPRLPVPPLQQTLDKYLKTISPITTPEQYQKTAEIVGRFAENEGPELHELLEKHAEGKDSWLADWWLNTAYLDYRAPNVINSNPGMVMPTQRFNSDEEWLAYAARLIRAGIDYKQQIDNENLEVEVLAGQPLCMIQYYKIFSTCRIPDLKRDRLVCYPPNKPNAPRHIVIIHNNQFFSLDVYGTDGRPLNEKQIHKLLSKLVSKSQTVGPPVGVLTTGNRNSWATSHKRLAKLGNNASHFDKIEKSIFVVCLDKPYSGTQDPGADEFTLSARQMLYGDGSHACSTNRWFDKTLQFIVGRNGNIGINYEHSPAEGPPVASLLDHMCNYLASEKENEAARGTTDIEQLEFKIDKTIEAAMETAKTEIDLFGADVQLTGHIFDGFGKNFAKSIKQSPDALIQVAMQLAYYRDQGHPCATYESASTRMFQLGRTDTIRSCTPASLAFCQTMHDSSDRAVQAKAFVDAVHAHREYTAAAVAGQGIDRHLLGLKLIAIENGMNVPDLHMDPTYSKAFHFNLSTSQVPCKNPIVLCFGPVVPDGYGFCYNPRSNEIIFVVSAFKNCDKTDSQNLTNRLCESLMDIKALFPTSAKL